MNGTLWTEQTRAEVLAAYQTGRSLRAVAAITGVPYTTVNRWVTDAGVMRPAGRPRT